MSRIEWTDVTWNPLAGCTRVSPGCDNCYAARTAATRLKHTRQHRGLAVITPSGRAAFNGTIRLLPERLTEPLHWWKPRRVFVNSMSDLFHEDVPEEYIDQVFAAMAQAPQHIYQVLTKRPERMRDYTTALYNGKRAVVAAAMGLRSSFIGGLMVGHAHRALPLSENRKDGPPYDPWPFVWLGVSVEDQQRSDERIPILLQTPAAVRFLSCEPLLGPINLSRAHFTHFTTGPVRPVDWVIVGGESGPDARPCNVDWIRSIVQQCQAADVPVFVKQLGAVVHTRNDDGFSDDGGAGGWPGFPEIQDLYPNPYQGDPVRVRLQHQKGGDPAEWPGFLRIREWPTTAAAGAGTG